MLPLLQISGLSVCFKQEKESLPAVRNFSLEIKPREIVAVVGESGSGKSVTALSLLQLLSRNAEVSGDAVLYPGTSGEMNLLHADEVRIRSVRGNRISMIFQEPMTALNPVMRCGKQVAEVLKTHKKITESESHCLACEAMEMAGLRNAGTWYDRYPHQLSGGQKQRLMIAMAIACRPDLLIADEPTTALDVRVQKEILLSLKNLRDTMGMAVLFITHDLGIVAEIADRVIVMKEGSVVETGSVPDLLENPAHPYTRELLAARPKFKETAPAPTIPGPEPDNPVLIEVSGLTVIHKSGKQENRVLDAVNMKIHQGEIVGLVGESGCGKTTLGKALLRLLPVHAGKIMLKGKEISGKKGGKSLSRDMQIIFQDPYGSLNPMMTAGHAIREAWQVNQVGNTLKKPETKLNELLSLVKLEPDHASRFPHQFSGGQRQRICIARALAAEPSFLVFDEATSALDVSIQAQILQLIRDLKEKLGLTALFISHDLAAVHNLCDRILIMKAGRIIEEGTPGRIFRDPAESYTRELLDAIPGKSLKFNF